MFLRVDSDSDSPTETGKRIQGVEVSSGWTAVLSCLPIRAAIMNEMAGRMNTGSCSSVTVVILGYSIPTILVRWNNIDCRVYELFLGLVAR